MLEGFCTITCCQVLELHTQIQYTILRSKYLPVIWLVLYSCEPLSIALGVENRVMVFESKMPKTVFIPKRGSNRRMEKIT